MNPVNYRTRASLHRASSPAASARPSRSTIRFRRRGGAVVGLSGARRRSAHASWLSPRSCARFTLTCCRCRSPAHAAYIAEHRAFPGDLVEIFKTTYNPGTIIEDPSIVEAIDKAVAHDLRPFQKKKVSPLLSAATGAAARALVLGPPSHGLARGRCSQDQQWAGRCRILFDPDRLCADAFPAVPTSRSMGRHGEPAALAHGMGLEEIQCPRMWTILIRTRGCAAHEAWYVLFSLP